MKSILSRIFLLGSIVFAAAAANFAQPSPNTVMKGGRIFDGESIVYEGKVSRAILRGISVAQLTFDSSVIPGTDTLLIRSKAVSKGTLLRLFRYSFLQEYRSTVDLSNFNILRTEKHDVQKERVRDSDALFDYNLRRVTYVETDPKDPTRPPRRIASELFGDIYDMVSSIYAVRMVPIAVGKRMEFSVSDSGLVYKVPFRITAREMQKTKLGKVWCYRIEPEIFGKDRLIERKGKMIIWMTDDDRRIPVRAQVDSEYGKIDIKLDSYRKTANATPAPPAN